MGVVTNDAKGAALRPPGHIPMADEVALLADVGMGTAEGGGAVVVGISIGTGVVVAAHVLKVVQKKKEGRSGLPLHASAKQTDKKCYCHKKKAITYKTGFLKQGVDVCLLRKACERTNNARCECRKSCWIDQTRLTRTAFE